ncbi:39S ribosomal protein L40, mitochondrial [Oncorhynchus nerka]|uniref:Large ribosomal subunit protein mL40 n=1 Tax=Oncorhynchus tshawytscha TaxID=74940 RepID=A0AAZ3PJF8_ONCTS|nr:39S ribosomal protein L40, mitochondrial isoform X1 [Oncorhynchus tshawytscha]XP_029534237.1 39S ribosomal protein L40, mitochondrial [Oncorhynchus nerka]XP_035613038.1 39S ribosomal protein L40, mitochondrial [Oncorhynchus keta]
MSIAVSRALCRVLSRQTAVPTNVSSLMGVDGHVSQGPWFASVLTLKTSAPLRAEPKKKKKVDPRREQMVRERLKKKLKKLERVPPELIPIEDFTTPAKYMDETRVRGAPQLPFEESERRALLLKEWSRYKQTQHRAEMEAVGLAVEAQREALEELRLESEELYQAALRPDPLLFPFNHQGPSYTPPKAQYEAPEGKYNNITKVYTQ